VRPQELHELTISQLARLISDREIGSEEYCRFLVARCDALSDLNALADHDWGRLIDAARRADDNPTGELSGIPLALKDNIDTAELTTTAGTGALRDFTATSNAPVLQKLFDEGALLGAKTNMHELAFGITSNNSVTGAVRNPYDRSMIPGGSSGGVAVAVAARMMPGGVGTDTGASIRLPAALCGCVGFRPSIGRYSAKGIVPISHTRDTAGPIVRSVEDAVLLDSIMACQRQDEDELEGPVRIGVPREYFYNDLDPEVSRIIDEILAELSQSGFELVEKDIAGIGTLNHAVSATVARYEFLRDLELYMREHRIDLNMTAVLEGVGSPDVRQVIEGELGSTAVSHSAYDRAITVDRPKLQATYADYFLDNRLDAVIFPTSPLPARPIGQDLTVELNGRSVPTFDTYLRNTDPASNAGIPGINLPARLTETGLPVGLELDAPAGRDRRLLKIAQLVEQVVGVLPNPGR